MHAKQSGKGETGEESHFFAALPLAHLLHKLNMSDGLLPVCSLGLCNTVIKQLCVQTANILGLVCHI